MTQRELSQLVATGESRYLEFKRRVPRPGRIAKEVIALANTHGGRLLLGVNDDGSIVGVRDAAEEEFALRRALQERCEPMVEVITERVPVTDKRDVIVVRVPESSHKPHFLRNGARRHKAYVRVEDKSVEASREAVRLMRSERNPTDVTFEFGEKEQTLMRYLDSYGRITVEQFATLVDIPFKQASHTLVLLAKANVLQLHRNDPDDYFTVAY
jgi:predicted HTH transcriptional regulator